MRGVSLRPLAEVQEEVLRRVTPLPPSVVTLADAAGLVLAEDVRAPHGVPPFANSAMDGYAVRKVDCARASEDAPVRLKVVDELPAGVVPRVAVGAGEAVRIMTGAPVPEGADGIVIVEHTERVTAPDGGDEVLVRRPAGDHIRPAGSDLVPGALVFPAGTVLGPAHLGVLASLGLAEATVHRRARVGVLSTGSELVPAGEPLGPGRIHDANRPMLLALVEAAGATAVDLGLVADEEAAVTEAVARGLESCDALITSGGVSVGEHDHVKAAIEAVGELHAFQVAIKPAKPFAFGVVPEARGGLKLVFGVPGNPVSSLVAFELLVRPALRRMMGQRAVSRTTARAVAGHDLRRRADGKVHYDRVFVQDEGGRWVARRTGPQESHVLSAMAHANALAVLPDGEGVAAGEEVEVILLDLPPGGPGA